MKVFVFLFFFIVMQETYAQNPYLSGYVKITCLGPSDKPYPLIIFNSDAQVDTFWLPDGMYMNVSSSKLRMLDSLIRQEEMIESKTSVYPVTIFVVTVAGQTQYNFIYCSFINKLFTQIANLFAGAEKADIERNFYTLSKRLLIPYSIQGSENQ